MHSTIPHKHLWSPESLSPDDLQALLQTTAMLKRARQRGQAWHPLRGRHLVLLCNGHTDAAEVFKRAVVDLGGLPVLLAADEWRRRAGTWLAEEARLLGRLYDAVDCCDLPLSLIEKIEEHSGVPVFNGLSGPDHPVRLVGDILTMGEAAGKALHLCRLAVRADDPAGVAAAAQTMARLAGMQVVALRKTVRTGAASTAVDPDGLDFILDPAAPASAHRLTMPRRTSSEQAQLTAQLQANRLHALDAAIACGLQ